MVLPAGLVADLLFTVPVPQTDEPSSKAHDLIWIITTLAPRAGIRVRSGQNVGGPVGTGGHPAVHVTQLPEMDCSYAALRLGGINAVLRPA